MTSTSTTASWIQHTQQRQEGNLRLFCFPYAGGGASIFRTWSDILPRQIEVCPIQLPGRENRLLESPFTEIAALLDSLGQALLPYLDMPYALFGHSMGALISFELARYLRREQGLSPKHLFVSGCCAPQIRDVDLPIHQLPETAFLAELRSLKGTPEAVLQNAELVRLLLPGLRADFAMCETYHYTHEEPLACPISAFGGLQDGEVNRNNLAGWREQTQNSFKLRFFVGNHFFVNTARFSLLQALAQDILQSLR